MTLEELYAIEHDIYTTLHIKQVEIGELIDRLDYVQREIKRLGGYPRPEETK